MTLEDCGFVRSGAWRLDGSLNSGIRCLLTSLQDERVVYAFRTQGAVRYVGVCEKGCTTLKARMGRYQNRQGAGQNERVAALIKSCLEAGEEVEVLALVPKPGVSYEGVCIDLVKGLENPLIELFHPDWNR